MPPTIDLSDTVGLGLVIAHPHGASYTNQTAGHACLRPVVVGYYVPLRNDYEREGRVFVSPEIELAAYFEGPRHRGGGAISGLDEHDADFVDGVLRRWRLSPALAVDRARLRASHEAWVHVQVGGDDASETYAGFGPYPRDGVLTWANSD